MTEQAMTREECIAKIASITKDVKFAMLTTVTAEGHLHAHPMTTQQTEFDGDVWFIGSKSSQQVQDMQARPQVNVSYAEPSKGVYVSINGSAELVTDPAKLDELWSDFYKAYFEGGKTDPDVQLIKIAAHGGEYWESDGKLRTLFRMAKGAVTGNTDLGGKNETVSL